MGLLMGQWLVGQTDGEMMGWIKAKQFNQVNAGLEGYEGKYGGLYQAVALNAFNRPAESMGLLVEMDVAGWADSVRFLHARMLYDNCVKSSRYAEAYAYGVVLRDGYKAHYDADEYDGLLQELKIWWSLRDVAPQGLVKNGDTRLKLERDLAGLKNMPIRIGDSTHLFVFDTGAGISCVTESYGKKLGVRMVSEGGIKIKGFTGADNDVRIGVVPELAFGNVVVRDVVVMVFADAAFSFADGAYVIHGILGFPVIKELGTFTLKGDSLIVPEDDPVMEVGHHNFVLDGLVPVIYVEAFGEELPCVFDTGDSEGSFNRLFYERFGTRLKGKMVRMGAGGAGGVREYDALVVKQLAVRVGEDRVKLKGVIVDTEHYNGSDGAFYGNMGQGLIGEFEGVRISFTNGVVEFIEESVVSGQ